MTTARPLTASRLSIVVSARPVMSTAKRKKGPEGPQNANSHVLFTLPRTVRAKVVMKQRRITLFCRPVAFVHSYCRAAVLSDYPS